MLNKDLHLNERLFEVDGEKKATRDGFGTGLVALGDVDPNVVVLTADLSESTRTDAFEKKFPERFFECGVAEQNMAAIAAGLAVTGKTAFISSYAAFSPGKNWETLRTTTVYNNANVKIAGHHAGIMTGPDGATHQATEDIASVRSWPGIEIIVPCDSIEAEKATIAVGKMIGPAYLRFTRDKTPVMTTPSTPFVRGKSQLFWTNPDPIVTIFGIGYMVYYCLLAAKQLEKEGVQVVVVNMSSIKPLDVIMLEKVASQTGAFVTVEDHQVMGGLGGAIAEWVVRNHPLPMEFVGLQDTFAESGKPDELLEKYNMGKDAIIAAVKKVFERKQYL